MTRARASRRSGDVGDGLPSLPTGEPVLHRWFVILMLVLVPLGLAVTAWAFLAIGRDTISPAERRPPGTATVTHDRGQATLNRTTGIESGPGCASGVAVFGDRGARAAARRALSATCQLLERPGLDPAGAGLEAWTAQDGLLRFGAFERTGVDASSRVEDGRIVIELNAKFQFVDASAAAPMIIHELVHLGGDTWPGAPVSAAGERAAMERQAAACERVVFRDEPPRGCRDAAELLAADDPLSLLTDAGYRPPSQG